MNSNLISIGTALKWRGLYDESKTYYKDNIIADLGCIFRCSANSTKGQAPVSEPDENGNFELTNTGIWDVILDMSSYYNKIADIEHYASEALAATAAMNEALAKIDEFTKKPIELKSEDELETLIAAGTIEDNQLYFTTES
jgi:hypothetical protein